jgi:DNA polymerase-4/DNA polymerase V
VTQLLIKPKKEKVILHMDGDAFFVACEVAKNPKLKGLPVVTGEERGIVSALSYEAKALGVIRGMPIFKLKKEFPQILVLPGDYACYVKYSNDMFEIVRRYADIVEEYSIDECFAELTGLDKPLYMSYKEIAERIKNEITGELGLSVSVGLAPTKVLAKVASKWKKPNGLTVITKETAGEFLKATAIDKVWGIGRQHSDYLKDRGVFTAEQFAEKDVYWIREHLAKPYEALWMELNSVSVMEIDGNKKTEYASMQRTRSFYPATNDKNFLVSQLSKHIEDACRKARHFNLTAQKVSFFLKSKDFKYFSFSTALPVASNSPELFVGLAKKHFDKMWQKGILYRTTGVTLQGLMPSNLTQTDLFGNSLREDKFEAIHKRIDLLEDKFGKRLVHLGSTHGALSQKVKGSESDDLDRNLLFL